MRSITIGLALVASTVVGSTPLRATTFNFTTAQAILSANGGVWLTGPPITAGWGGDSATVSIAHDLASLSSITFQFPNLVQYVHIGDLTINEADIGVTEASLTGMDLQYSFTINGFPTFTIHSSSIRAYNSGIGGDGVGDYVEMTWPSSAVAQLEPSGGQISSRILMSETAASDAAKSTFNTFSTVGGGDIDSVWAEFTYTDTPEPGTVALLGAGLAGLAVLAHRRRKFELEHREAA